MHDIEKRIRDQRLIEATNKGLTGLDGKIGTVLQQLGEYIVVSADEIGHDGFSSSSTLLYEEDEEEGLPTLDSDEARAVGIVFDGLRRGIHMEIIYMKDHNTLKLHYEGRLVYSEEEGELTCYVPEKWEDKINSLYLIARTKEESARKDSIKIEKKEAEREKLSFLAKLRKKWGL